MILCIRVEIVLFNYIPGLDEAESEEVTVRLAITLAASVNADATK